MMYQGLLGAFPFTVTESEACTFRDFKSGRELSYAEHKALDGLSRLQYTGRNLDTVSFSVIVAPLGLQSTVDARLLALTALAVTGKEMPLVIGLKWLGLHVLKSYEILRKQFHFGVCRFAEITMNLQEYN